MKLLPFVFTLCIYLPGMTQNIGIGTTNALRAKLEVHGVAGSGATNAIFAAPGNAGISLQQNWPTIGFNQFRDIITPGSQGKYMNDGYASLLTFDYGTGRMGMQMFPYGTANSFTPAGNTAFTILNNGNLGVRNGGLTDASLWVNKINTNLAAVTITGTTHSSQFLFGSGDDTYIRSGKDTGTLFISNIPNGKVSIGLNDTKTSTLNITGSVSYKARRTTAVTDTLSENDYILFVDLQNTWNFHSVKIYLPAITPQMEGRVYIIRMLNAPRVDDGPIQYDAFLINIENSVNSNFIQVQMMPSTENNLMHYTEDFVERRGIRSGASYICMGGEWIRFDEQFQFDDAY